MTGQTTDEASLNLGRYTIRPVERLPNLKVGSFYRRRQTSTCEQSSVGFSSYLRKQTQQSSKNRVSQSVNRARGSITSRSTSRDSSVPSPIAVGELVFRRPALSGSSKLSIDDETVGSKQPDNLFSAREDSSGMVNSMTSNSPKLTIDTHSSIKSRNHQDSCESLVIDLNPEGFRSTCSEDEETTISSISTSEGLQDFSLRTPDEPCVQMRSRVYPKQLPYDYIMSGVVFVMSGIENPRRSKLKELALEMGATYKPRWTRFCTHLICGFKNTPKYKEVMAENGRIVREHWIQECSKERLLLDWRNYKLGEYPCPVSEEEVSDLD